MNTIKRLESQLAKRQADYAAARRALRALEFSRSADAFKRARQNVQWTRDEVFRAMKELEDAARGVAS